MYPKNAASPPVIAVGQVILIADGSVVTADASARVKIGTGDWGASAGTLACDSTSGCWTYTPSQAETNAESFIVAVYKASCIGCQVTVVTTASATAGKAYVSNIDNDAITAASINTGALTADAFAADSIVAATLATGAITADAFAADAIVAATLATGVLTSDAFAAGAITNAAVADDVDVNTKTITAGAITATAIANDAITAAKIAAGAIDAATFAADVDAEARSWLGLATNNLDTQIAAVKSDTAAVLLDTGTDGVVLAADAITSAKIADNAIAAEHLAAEAIDFATFAADCKTGTGLKANVESITAGAITATAIADAAIDNATFAADVGSTAYASNIIALAVRKVLDELNLDHLMKTGDATLTNIVADNTAMAHLMAIDADISDYDDSTHSLEAIAGAGGGGAPTVEQIRAEIDLNSTKLADIVADTNELQGAWANGGRLDLIIDAIVDDTGTSGVKLADASIGLDTFDNMTAYPLKYPDQESTKVARTGADADTLETLSDEIAAVKSDTADILTDTGTTLDGIVDSIKTTTDKLDTALELDGAVYRFTENALEEGGAGGGATAEEVVTAFGTGSFLTALATADSITVVDANVDAIKATVDKLDTMVEEV